jgi:putative ABC transport system substrate-binding protein
VKRREFITLLGGAAAAWPFVVRAQQRVADDRILRHEHARSTESMDRRILQRLRELGWIEGRTVAVEYRWAQGRTERHDEIAAELVRLNVDVIVTTVPTVAALKHATSVIPIVFGGRARARRTA